jgi:hypothetical protein
MLVRAWFREAISAPRLKSTLSRPSPPRSRSSVGPEAHDLLRQTQPAQAQALGELRERISHTAPENIADCIVKLRLATRATGDRKPLALLACRLRPTTGPRCAM